MVEVGQLRRWTYSNPPVPEEWYDKVFLVVRERLRYISMTKERRSSWDIMVEGSIDEAWTTGDLESLSEVISGS
jgi:hypothetical protein